VPTPSASSQEPAVGVPTRLPEVQLGTLAAVYEQETAGQVLPAQAEILPWVNQNAAETADADSGDEVSESSLAERLDELEKKYADLSESQDDLSDELSGYVRTGHGEETMKLSGRIHFDMWEFPETTPGINGFETGDLASPPQDQIGFRRLRFGVAGDVWENMEYKIEMEFAGGNNVEFRDAYLGFTELPCLQTVRIGNQKRPYGLDHWNSSRYNVFLERPFIIEAFNQDARRLGIQSWSHSEDLAWNWQYGVFNQRLVQDEGHYISNNWQPEFAGRLANTIWYDECSGGRGYAHWAVSGAIADPDGFAPTENYADSGINEARFRTRPEARSENRWLDTQIIDFAQTYTLLGLENVINLGPLQLAGEYQNIWLDRLNGSQLNFHGGYVYAAYFLTGEYMPWNREEGQLDRPKPLENFFLVDTCRDGVRGGYGAWQVAARWSYGDLSDDDIQGGIGESVTLGLNWLWNPYARMQFNYIYGDIHDNALNAVGGVDFGHYQIVGTRFLIDF
jgi:phosphate-selective porin OprO and OprP